jgi:hypothetical protein
MAPFIQFFKKQWNLVAGIAATIVVVATDIIVPQDVSLDYAEGSINMTGLLKFLVTAVILLLSLPLTVFREKKYAWRWWGMAIASLVATGISLFFYLDFLNGHTVFYSQLGERVVVGQTLQPAPRHTIDSIERTEKRRLSKTEIVEAMGEPKYLWEENELLSNSRTITWLYPCFVLFICLAIVFSMQALYCLTRKRTGAGTKKPKGDVKIVEVPESMN